ncbi:unnamed protein product [Alopecurus aequalis]
MTERVQTDDVVKKCIEDVFAAIKPTDNDVNLRHEALHELKDCISSVETLRGAVVKPYGSFVSNLYAISGDLDMSVELWNNSNLPRESKTKEEKNVVLEIISRALESKGISKYVHLIPSARVPILQYVSRKVGISCDISIDNLTGLTKSKVFYWINNLDGRFRDMVLLVKEWAKCQGINDAKDGTLNSYSLCLLVVFHFQRCKPAILPPLKEIYDVEHNEAYFDEERLDKVCKDNIKKFQSQDTWQRNESSLSHLLATFFQRFSFIDTTSVISTYEGRLKRIEDSPYPQRKSISDTLLVEDPFERPLNAARSVKADTIDRISTAFTHASSVFVLDGRVAHRDELLSLLCTPDVRKAVGVETAVVPYTNPAMKGFLQSVMQQELVKEKGHLHCSDDMPAMLRFLHIPGDVAEDD